jgi:predicted Rossmann fold flavoprotein
MWVRVVGAGPAGLMAAEVLSSAAFSVEIIDHHKSPARKFLLAGRGGLNLTHSEPLEQLLNRYGPDRAFLEPAIRVFPPDALRQWCEGLGVETFVGSTGRVFPKGLKASPLLRAWLRRLQGQGVVLNSATPWRGFDDVPTILAMGGASWPELGSDASWVKIFEVAGVKVNPFRASNVRQPVQWTAEFARRCAGKPIKNVAARVGDRQVRGEIMIAEDGIEGGAIYALSRAIRENTQHIALDLKPDLSAEEVARRMALRGKDSFSNHMRKRFNLTPQAIDFMRETRSENPKSIVVSLTGEPSLQRAISSAGGVDQAAVDATFALHKFPATCVVGEMLDWDAPTGGYLLQACFSTAFHAATAMVRRLKF